MKHMLYLLINKIRSSFSRRLSFYILCGATTVFTLTLLGNYHSARNFVRTESIEHAQVALDNTILQIDQVLNSVEIAVQNLSWVVGDKLDSPDYMYELTTQMLRTNPHVVGSAIAFEPDYYPEKGQMYSPYSYRDGSLISTKQLGTENYDYHYMDWYQIPKLLGQPYWSEPYYDKGGADVIMTTYSYPLFDADGNLYAIFTADISLEWFADKVESIKPYPRSFNLMIGRGGTFLVHWEKDYILRETLFASERSIVNKNLVDMAHRMVDGERGMMSYKLQNEDFYLFYAPVKATGWSVAVACLHSDVFAAVGGLRNMVVAIMAVGLLLLTCFCYFTIRRLTLPLVRFADSANQISCGNFMASLPRIKGRDEMKTLHDSFDSMQKSLVTYIDELKRTTASKERIESELRIAREIQLGMVPKIFPPFPERSDIDVYAKLIPAREVGGDLYDFFIEDNKFYFIVGDVSGKGVPASLVMAVTCRLFRTIAVRFSTPSEIMSALNDTLAEKNDSNMFCTAFLGIFDLQSGHLHFCNAGHNAPVRIASGARMMEIQPNIPLGVFAGFPYQGQECVLSGGDSLFLYTDGVTEAENVNKELYTDARLLALLAENGGGTSADMVGCLLSDVAHHAQGTEQSDDITVMCFKYMAKMKKTLTLRNDIAEIALLHAFIDELAAQSGLSSELVFNLNLVLEEAVSNVILYAYPKEEQATLTLTAEVTPDELVFELRDSGPEFDPTAVSEPDITLSAEERPIGGLGIYLIRQLMDKVEYSRIDGQNVFVLGKKLKKGL